MSAAGAAAARAAKTNHRKNHGGDEGSFNPKLNADSPARRMSRALSEGAIMRVRRALKKEDNGPNTLWRQREFRAKYETNVVQIGVAVVIALNFFISAINAQILPDEGSNAQMAFFGFEIFFAVVFTVELIWNMYGSWWCLFWQSGWNWFDFIIVLISLMSLMLSDLPGISVLRLFRAFRVFRLFKRVPSLKMIIEGILASLPGVMNAFLVLGILMGIWSIMGVEFFKDFEPMYFGNFMKAMFTMWQVMTMDSWASNIARAVVFREDCEMCAYAAVYFLSYVFCCGIIMTNVIVAILLEKYLEATSKDDEEEEEKERAEEEMTEEEVKEFGTPKIDKAADGGLGGKRASMRKSFKKNKAANVGRLDLLDRSQLLQLAGMLKSPDVWSRVFNQQINDLQQKENMSHAEMADDAVRRLQ
jgi:voltage-gated sodium channel